MDTAFYKSAAHKLNLVDPSFYINPYTHYERIRPYNTIYWDNIPHAWVFISYADILRASSDVRFSSERALEIVERLPKQKSLDRMIFFNFFSNWSLLNDPPLHTHHRAILNQAFSSKMIASLSHNIHQLVSSLLDSFIPLGKMDVINDFAFPLTISVISLLLGIPRQDQNQIKAWSEGISSFLAAPIITVEIAEYAQKCIVELSNYLKLLILENKESPQNYFMTSLLQSNKSGNKLNESELISIFSMLLLAGLETTTNLIGNGLLALLKHPVEFQKLRNNISLLPQAIDELLRYDSPIQMTSRIAREDIQIREHRIRKGSRIFFFLGAANRDPEQFQNPERLDFSRTENRSLAFGHGIHFCPGAMLAKIEAHAAFKQIIERISSIELSHFQLEWRSDFSFRGLKSLPIQFTPHSVFQ